MGNYPALCGTVVDMETTAMTFDQAEARLAETLPGYESREPQQRLARSVEESLADGVHLFAQAGTGTGKSLATLIPAILSGKTVAVSTATKALQDQLTGKDLPFLTEHLGVDFTWAVLKGRSNYLCLNALGDFDDAAKTSEIWEFIKADEKDGEPTFDGLRENLPVEVTEGDWRNLTVSGEDCIGKECPFYKSCFATKAKQRAQAAQVIVVNHALLANDLNLKSFGASMLPVLDAVIVDEAHEFESYVGSALGSRFTEFTVKDIEARVRGFVKRYGIEADEVLSTSLSAVVDFKALFEVLEAGRIRQATIAEHADSWERAGMAITDMAEAVSTIGLGTVSSDKYEKAKRSLDILIKRVWNAQKAFVETLLHVDAGGTDIVVWVEEERLRRGGTRLTLQARPLRVDGFLRDNLFAETTTIAVSATIAPGGNFGYIAGRLGCDTYRSLDVGTPFDYQTQARVFIPDLPNPSKERRQWEALVPGTVRDLILASGGGALVLFTSYRQMKAVYEAVNFQVPMECRMQGDATNPALVAWLKEDPTRVLFATRSFMTGVDIQGEALRLVIVDKMPFAVPTDPMVEANIEAIERTGGNAFSDYSIPEMSLVLQQAHGRLIRHRDDTGVFALLDPRATKANWGRKAMAGVPDSPTVSTVEEVADFLGR